MIQLDRPTETAKSGAVCADCTKIGADWLHLRLCLTCGHIGCCDDSPNRHARKHFEAENHPIIASHEPKERWRYCFVDDVLV
ncbi:UBP-type zinc finger domain-containing protein [Gymnodinialimonas sp. 2305UL16-5]|uniref:UBP-type zinc finger domain-containing protein n=1 Tax=Gymnodinialimonas mytili TaxID=3126503 RepID=UPI0030A88CCF